MSHANAALTPKARLKLARLVVDDGWPIARAAERFQVSWPTAKRWVERYRQAGEARRLSLLRRASPTLPPRFHPPRGGFGVASGVLDGPAVRLTAMDGRRRGSGGWGVPPPADA